MKDAYYFSHDSNARNDQRLMKLRMKYGPEGYGIYFMIIEILRDTENYTLHMNDISSICFDIRADEEKVLDIIKNFRLFEFDGEYFQSRSLSRRMEKLDNIKEKRRESGKLGGKAKANNYQTPSKSLASAKQVKKSKEDKSKEDKIKEKYDGFKKQVFEFKSNYDLEMLEDFISYWTETNKSKSIMRYEQEKTWDTDRRLQRWHKNAFNSTQSPANQFQKNGSIDEATSGRYSNLAEQSKRFRSYMEDAEKTAAEPTEIRQILGETIKKLKPIPEAEEEKDGQQDLHRD
tara:strand:- start:443 stop:1309 length:867 start_codon:yes stop_codon:yes gene_type:complete